MGNNLQGVKTLKGFNDNLGNTGIYNSKVNGENDEVNPSDKLGSDGVSSRSLKNGVTRLNQQSSYWSKNSEWLKESQDKMTAASTGTPQCAQHNSSTLPSSNPFVYYLPPKPQNETTVNRTASNETPVSPTASKSPCVPKPVVVDLTGDDSDDESHEPQNTFPKILAAYSLSSKHAPFPGPELCSLLRKKAKENNAKPDGAVCIASAPTKHKPAPSSSKPINDEPVRNIYDVIGNYINREHGHEANSRNDVMNDVTNTRNIDVNIGKKSDFWPFWSSRQESMVESSRQIATTSSDESDDQIIITKVVDAADKPRPGRAGHPRKTPVEVRKLYFDQQDGDKHVERRLNGHHNNSKLSRPSTDSCVISDGTLQGMTVPGDGDCDESGTPWSFRLVSADQPESSCDSYRENQIRTLKNLLARQEENVERIRNSGSPHSVSTDRVLIVQIPDLKSKLRLPIEGTQSFRVLSRTPGNKNSPKTPAIKGKRKTDPQKVKSQPMYPSYVRNTGSLPQGDRYVPSKKTRIDRSAKQRVSKRIRGRCSPIDNKVPVVAKDLWHREMEKAEFKLVQTPVDKTTFMLFLGLRTTNTPILID